MSMAKMSKQLACVELLSSLLIEVYPGSLQDREQVLSIVQARSECEPDNLYAKLEELMFNYRRCCTLTCCLKPERK